jgi:hypothetical protein
VKRVNPWKKEDFEQWTAECLRLKNLYNHEPNNTLRLPSEGKLAEILADGDKYGWYPC